jgi:hypothetical protein
MRKKKKKTKIDKFPVHFPVRKVTVTFTFPLDFSNLGFRVPEEKN